LKKKGISTKRKASLTQKAAYLKAQIPVLKKELADLNQALRALLGSKYEWVIKGIQV